ncbi:PadR family transcriptional regulator [Agromyces sp. Marseille-Q5079]|uniref:PadR family transcriptional regulator n=1 Tax=Agromyces sp. Marseille-Q5079 TaxID=3439059 RepID=UPI003D9CAE9B
MARRRPGTLFPLEVRILQTGAAMEGSFYGFGIAHELAQDDNEGLIAHGTLYKALSRMTTAGLLEAEWEDPSISETEGRPRRRLYRLTAEGVRALSTHESQQRTAVAVTRMGLA